MAQVTIDSTRPADSTRRTGLTSVVAFAVPAILLLYYGFRGGSYDIVARQEEALAIWWIVGLGFAFGVFPRARAPRGVLVPLGAILLLAVWTAISMGWTESQERTFAELARFLHYAGLLILVWAVVDKRTWRPAAAGLIFAAVVICGAALISRLYPSVIPTNVVLRKFVDNRLSYPFNYWNAVAAFGAMTSAMALGASTTVRSLPLRALALACVPLCVATTYVTYSRAGVIGSAFAIVLLVVISRNRFVTIVHIIGAGIGSGLGILAIRGHHQIVEATGTAGAGTVTAAILAGSVIAAASACVPWFLRGDQRWHVPKRPATIATVAGVILLVVLVPTAGHADISDAWHSFKKKPVSVNTQDPAARLSNLNGNRYYIWRSAVRGFNHHPLDGTGAGTFEFWWSRTGGDEFLRDAHSLYLEEFSEQGVFGGVLILVFVIGLAVAAFRARRAVSMPDSGLHAALVVGFIVYLFHAGVDWMWESTTVTVLALLAIALAAAAASERAARPLGIPTRVGVVALSAVAFLIQLPGLSSVSSTRTSQKEFARGELRAALSDAGDAIAAEPWAASPYAQRALVEEAQGNLTAARADLLRAQSREPTNYQHPLILARVDAELGDTAGAIANIRRAKELRPRSPFVGPER